MRQISHKKKPREQSSPGQASSNPAGAQGARPFAFSYPDSSQAKTCELPSVPEFHRVVLSRPLYLKAWPWLADYTADRDFHPAPKADVHDIALNYSERQQQRQPPLAALGAAAGIPSPNCLEVVYLVEWNHVYLVRSFRSENRRA